MKALLWSTIAVVVVGVGANLEAASTWDLQQDFTTTSNPNGAWTYGFRLSPAGTAFTKYTLSTTASFPAASLQNLNIWRGLESNTPLLGKNLTGVTLDAGEGTLIPAGEIAMHPGGFGSPDAFFFSTSVARWTAPVTGTYSFAFSLARFGGTLGGDGGPTGVSGFDLVIGGVSVYSQSVSGYAFGAVVTREYELGAGANVDFAVSCGDFSDNYDSTGLRATVAILPEPGVAVMVGGLVAGLGRRRRGR